MKFIDWLKSLRVLRSCKRHSRRAKHRFTPSWKQSLCIPPATECLEDRTMLSGVTILTHGAAFNSDSNELEPWLAAMSNAIVSRIEDNSDQSGEVAQFRLSITGEDETPTIAENGWSYLPGFSSQTSARSFNLAHSLDSEAVIVLDWSSIAGVDAMGGWETHTQLVANSVSDFLSNTLGPLGKQLLSLPIHLIGHSRGGSLVGALAEDFGELGLLVDQVTFLDTHPIPEDYGYSTIGTDVMPFENVIFADSYWRADVQINGSPFDFDGAKVTGAFNRRLNVGAIPLLSDSEGVLDQIDGRDLIPPLQDPFDPGYTQEHSDVHLWYQGTIDTNSEIVSDGEAEFDPDDWYVGDMGPRDEIGYYFSRIGGGDRPVEGLNPALNEEGEWEAISDHSDDVWSSIVELQIDDSDLQFFSGDLINVDFYYRDTESETEFSLFIDNDRNPFNNSGERRVGDSVPLSLTENEIVRVDNLSVNLNGVDVGDYFVYGQIRDKEGHTRYTYAPQKITIIEDPFAGIDLFGSNAYVTSAPVRPGDLINYSFTFSNSGSDPADPFAVEWYLSQDSTIDKNDRKIGRQNILGLDAGATTPADFRGLVLPGFSDEFWNGNGTYYIGTIIDPENEISESNEANNSNAGFGLDFISIQIEGFTPLPGELVVKNLVDESDGIYGDDLSLREAIELANANPDLQNYDVITFDIDVNDPEIRLSQVLGELSITRNDLSIVGTNQNAAGGNVHIDGQDEVRIINVTNSNVDLKLWNLWLTHGMTNGDGGGIYNEGGSVSLFDGCLIQGCSADDGGGIYSDEGVIRLSNSKVRINESDDHGGGIYISDGTLSITQGSRIDENTSISGRGGGIYSVGSTVTISDSDIVYNVSDGSGGGIRNSGGTLTVSNSLFNKNESNDQAGGLYNSSGVVDISQCIFRENESEDNGGGIYSVNGQLTLTGSTLEENRSNQSGGGIAGTGNISINGSTISKNSAQSGGGVALFGNTSTKVIFNSTISENTATVDGGGLETNASVTIVNSTLTRNRSDSDNNVSGVGGGIYNSGSLTLHNTIVAGNFQGSGSLPADISGTVTGSHNLIGNADSAGSLLHNVDGNIVGNEGTGTIPIETVLDTQLDNHAGPTETHALVTNSPAINAGSNTAAQNVLLSTDQRGQGFARIADGTIDIGALEIQSLNLVVDTLTDESDLDYSTGDLSLREAIARANANPGMDTISFDIGTNNPEIRLLSTLGELGITDDLLIDGINTNITGGRVSIDGQQSVRVLYIDSSEAIVGLSNLTIKNGWTNSVGAGLLNEGGTVTITGSDFSGHVSQGAGGGINSKNGSLTIINSSITDNTSEGQGAGIYTTNNITEISGSIIFGNVSEGEGGGIYSNSGEFTLTASTISGNQATSYGGGISGKGQISIIASTISGNAAESGGGIYLDNTIAEISILNSTISGNTARENGGGLDMETDVTIINSTITGNQSDTDGDTTGLGGGLRISDGIITLENTIVAGNIQGTDSFASDISGTVTGNHNLIGDAGSSGSLIDGSDGNIVGNQGSGTLEISSILNTILRDNGGLTQTHELVTGSLAIDAGLNLTAINAGLETDQRGSNRVLDGNHNSTSTVDIGSLELSSIASQYHFRIVENKTDTQSNGEIVTLPEALDWIGEWDTYWLEIWLSTPSSSDLGIVSGTFNLNYNTEITSAVEIEFGSAFSENRSGSINDSIGSIENLSAETTLSDVGGDQYVLFARIRFESSAEDAIDLDLEGQSLNPQSPDFVISNPEILLAGDETSSVIADNSLSNLIYANPLDLNDDGLLNYRDLILLVSVYGVIPSESVSDYAWAADLNQDDLVNYRDLIAFVTNYGKSKSQSQEIIYPNNYPDAWNQQLLVTTQFPQTQKKVPPLKQSQAESLLQTAFSELNKGLSFEDQQKLASVKIEVVDLSGTTLGKATADTIYVDVNAAGYGWFIDQTPLDHNEFQSDSQLSLIALPDSEAAGLIDLWTVIRHELGHLLGYEHAEEGVMESVLDPGERKLADWSEDADGFFASLQEDTELLSF